MNTNIMLTPIYPIIYLHGEIIDNKFGPTTEKINNTKGKNVLLLETIENVDIFPGKKETAIKVLVDNKIGWTFLSHYITL